MGTYINLILPKKWVSWNKYLKTIKHLSYISVLKYGRTIVVKRISLHCGGFEFPDAFIFQTILQPLNLT